MLLALGGCTGHARISLLSLNRQAIDPPRVEPWEFDARECVWWVDDAGQFNLAMRSRRAQPLLGELGGMELVFWMAPGTPPAGIGRDYTLRAPDFRGMLISPLFHQRFVAYAGVVSVVREMQSGGEISYRGSFRIWTTPMMDVTYMTLLPPRRGPVLGYGTFRAVHDPDLGHELRSRAGMPTATPTTTAPAAPAAPGKNAAASTRPTTPG